MIELVRVTMLHRLWTKRQAGCSIGEDCALDIVLYCISYDLSGNGLIYDINYIRNYEFNDYKIYYERKPFTCLINVITSGN